MYGSRTPDKGTYRSEKRRYVIDSHLESKQVSKKFG